MSSPVNENDGDESGADIDSTNDGGVKQSRVGTVTQDIKQLSSIEHDGVNAGELLEEGNQNGASLQATRHWF